MQTLITIMIVLANFTANIGEINNTQWHEVYTQAHESNNTIVIYEDGIVLDRRNSGNNDWNIYCLSVGACQD